MKWIAILAVAAVAACGVDGPPERPAPPRTAPESNISISGHATMGVITEL
ncbi:hypothetical protein [Paracoccus sediminis]|uniref:Uncharacterized protein n=1 Tax=Paracoccus sediminis TaxID=1214787 RepID=A0A238VXY1_9RHOB|nr:hypothetical protein [Paracoccus sediminis]SNR39041.1 hypothetical protein SAMN06265378_103157 [Paracoccus sediminis]